MDAVNYGTGRAGQRRRAALIDDLKRIEREARRERREAREAARKAREKGATR